VTDDQPLNLYTCVLLDAANHVLKILSNEFPDESAAMKHAVITVFSIDAAAGYELWLNGQRVARFMKPGPGRS